ncbi:MAG: sigma-70 family RNA polymerase sigma factor, partial [Streptosporangiaceae bacterium]
MKADGEAGGEQRALELARSGDDSAFGALVGPYRAELHAHCYRMLGSVHDAEDALQDALLRAWKGLPGFEGRSSVRSWLYTVVTNAALDLAKRRPRSELEPYPDRLLGDLLEPSPEAMHEQRESLELAFIVALHELPPLQRAVLILREVMGFSAAEISGQLGTSVPSVTSALQRARVTVQA